MTQGFSVRFDIYRFICTLAFIVMPDAPFAQIANGTRCLNLWPSGVMYLGNGGVSVELHFWGLCAYVKVTPWKAKD